MTTFFIFVIMLNTAAIAFMLWHIGRILAEQLQ